MLKTKLKKLLGINCPIVRLKIKLTDTKTCCSWNLLFLKFRPYFRSNYLWSSFEFKIWNKINKKLKSSTKTDTKNDKTKKFHDGNFHLYIREFLFRPLSFLFRPIFCHGEQISESVEQTFEKQKTTKTIVEGLPKKND